MVVRKCAESILHGDIASLAETLSKRQALFMAKWAEGYKYNSNPDDFLATEKAIEIYEKNYCQDGGLCSYRICSIQIATLFPSSSRELIEKTGCLLGHLLLKQGVWRVAE